MPAGWSNTCACKVQGHEHEQVGMGAICEWQWDKHFMYKVHNRGREELWWCSIEVYKLDVN